ncbi:MAG: PEP-CTERM sorting domain-containing protein [Proteobacteria bacterium]|nr:PEP-CTERM sorting domain-containing protein [Pseudomonadota bacterium]MBU1713960.1 PEP-CTERM sorting domain-containing protein [Pseudomonadota bacterium]
MKKILLTLILVFCIAGVASADILTDTTVFTATGTIASEDYVSHGWGNVNYLNWTSDYVTWNHQFTFIPPAAIINSATLLISFTDDERDRLNPLTWDIGIGWTESGQWDFGSVDTGLYPYDVNVDFLADGIFQVTIASVWGDFYINQSDLTINYTPVPEPTTMLLLGLGLLGVAGIRRFKK